MGLTKQYLRYIPAGNFNIIASSRCNAVFVTLQAQEGRFVATGACEHVIIWDLRLGEKAQVLLGEKAMATSLAFSPNRRHLAVGYADGVVKTFDLRSGENVSIFVGHRSEITSLGYDKLGHRLVSGSKDTDIVVWDVVAETGVCRLTGHKGAITKVAFFREHDIIVSASKDTFVKFWDLKTQHNFKTLTGHRSEVWGLTLAKDDHYLVTGCNEKELFVWKVYFVDNAIETRVEKELVIADAEDETEFEDMRYPMRCERAGSILRAGAGRVVSLGSDATGRVVGCHGVDNTVELFHFVPDDVVQSRVQKRQKRAKRKAAKDGGTVENVGVDDNVLLKNQIKRLSALKVSRKAKSLDLVLGKGGELRVSVCVDNNSVELWSVATEGEDDIKTLRTLVSHGHRTDVRALCFSSDNLALATASGDSIKLWNRPSLVCLRTVECGYALTACFAPGDRHLIVGMKDGKILIVDIASGDILEEISAHTKELWSLTLFPDMRGVASGGGDCTVKFWTFELVEDPESETKTKVLSLLHSRTLTLEESVLSVRISPNGRFIAVALLDSTVKIFFLDTFKFFISLYGHKLPVVCMDISSDSTLIATGSADRNIKIWGLDYGDCHKSIFAHDDSVTGLAFVPRTHYLFTCGKDGKVKQWDADIFQKIITLQGHAGEAWNCAVSPNGMFVASCGSDKVVRLYERSTEPLVLEDEAEEEREMLENELATTDTSAVQGQKAQSLPSRKTVSSEKGAELILECLEISKNYHEQLAAIDSVAAKPPPLPPLMQALSCKTTEHFLLETVKRVRPSELEETLLILPYSAACEILKTLPKLLKSDYQAELVCRLTLHLVNAHHGPIVSSKELLNDLETIKSLAMERITDLRDTVGFNLYGMAFTQRAIEEQEGLQLFKDATKGRRQKNRVRRNKEKALKRAIMAL